MDITTRLLRDFIKDLLENPTPITRFEEIKPDPRRWIFRDLGLEGKILRKHTLPDETIHASDRNFGLIWGNHLPFSFVMPEIFAKAYMDLSDLDEIPLEDLNEYKKQRINAIKESWRRESGVDEPPPPGSWHSEKIRSVRHQQPKIILVAVASEEDLSALNMDLSRFDENLITKLFSGSVSVPTGEILKANVDYSPEAFGPYKVLQEFLKKFNLNGIYTCEPEITAIVCTSKRDSSGAMKISEVKHILQWIAELMSFKPEEPSLGFSRIDCFSMVNTARPVENEDLMKKELQAIIDAHNNASISKQLNEPKAESPFVQEKSSSM